MLVSTLALGIILLGLMLWAHRQPKPPHQAARAAAWGQLQALLIRLPLALLAAGFIAALLPQEYIIQWLGANSGF